MTPRKYTVIANVRKSGALGTFQDETFEVGMDTSADNLLPKAIEIINKRGYEVNHVASISYETAGAQ